MNKDLKETTDNEPHYMTSEELDALLASIVLTPKGKLLRNTGLAFEWAGIVSAICAIIAFVLAWPAITMLSGGLLALWFIASCGLYFKGFDIGFDVADAFYKK